MRFPFSFSDSCVLSAAFFAAGCAARAWAVLLCKALFLSKVIWWNKAARGGRACAIGTVHSLQCCCFWRQFLPGFKGYKRKVLLRRHD